MKIYYNITKFPNTEKISPESVSDLIREIKKGYRDLEKFEEDPEPYDLEEIEFLKTDLPEWEDLLSEYKYEFSKENPQLDWEKESAYLRSQFKENWEKE